MSGPSGGGTTPTAPSTTAAFGDVSGVKAAPGAAAMTGTSLAASGTITFTNRKLVGSTIGGRFSLGKFQPR